MTLEAFSEIFALLAVQLQFADADEATIRGYFAALKDLELEFIAMAAQRFGQRDALNVDGKAWFPKAPEWRKLAEKIEGERYAELAGRLRKRQVPACNTCGDTGWANVERGHNDGRWRHCACRRQWRLMVLGRQPMPQLQEGA
jgi:hypothetical protein